MEKILFEIEMQDGNVMKGELYPEVAPITVENFVNLIKNAQFKKIVALSNLIQRIYHNDIRNMLP